MCSVFFIVLSSLLVVVNSEALNPTKSYAKHVSPGKVSDSIEFFWHIADAKLHFALIANTRGWFAVGFGEPTQGTMKGSDVILFGGDGEIQDMFALAEKKPVKDVLQDCTKVSFSKNDTHSLGEFERPLNTNDFQDWNVDTTIQTRLIFAYGKTTEVTYHGTNRWIHSMYLGDTPADPSLEEGVQVFSAKVPSWPVPARKTVYACTAWKLPDVDAHMIKYEVNTGTPNHVHHMIVYGCTGDAGVKTAQKYLSTSNCEDQTGCSDLILLWAPGRDATNIPKEAGFRIGSAKSYSMKYILMQTHIDNAKLETDLKDTTEVKVYYTTKLRPNDAGVMLIGDPSTDLPSLPPGKNYIPYEVGCPGECTSDWDHPINVWGTFLHMHHIGERIWLTTHRKNGSFEELYRIDYWDYAAPRYGEWVTRKYYPGDQWNLQCVYNTEKLKNKVHFSAGTDDEMCMAFLLYYPVVTTSSGDIWSYCGSLDYRNQKMGTVCGNFQDKRAFKVDVPNAPPEIRNPVGCHTRAFGVSGKVELPVCDHPLRLDSLQNIKGAVSALRPFAGACTAWECKYGGKCVKTGNALFPSRCECLPVFGGPHCELPKTRMCKADTCKNGGTCSVQYGHAVCDCPDKYYGDKCEKTTKPSSSCDHTQLTQCILGAKFADQCRQLKAYVDCAKQHSCADMAQLWCSTLLSDDYECGTWEFCEKPTTDCNSALYGQCISSTKNGSNKCTAAQHYYDCAKISKCPDFVAYMCKRKDLAVCSAVQTSCGGSALMLDSEMTAAFDGHMGVQLVSTEDSHASSGHWVLVVSAVVGVLVVVAVVAISVYIKRSRHEEEICYEELRVE